MSQSQHENTHTAQQPTPSSTPSHSGESTQAQPRRWVIRYAVPKPIFVDAVHPFDTIERHIARKLPGGHGPSLSLVLLAIGFAVCCGLIAQNLQKRVFSMK
jgi:hypothetical protein